MADMIVAGAEDDMGSPGPPGDERVQVAGRAATASPTPPGDLVDYVASEVRANADAWFPGFDARRAQVHVLAADARARCFLYRAELTDGRVRRPVVIKVRHSLPDLRRLDRFEGRPILHPERTMPDQETARREHDGLRMISAALGEDDRFGVLRALAWVPEHAAIVMDLVEEPTLRTVLLETGRFHRRRSGPMDETPWRNAGAALRLFHGHESPFSLPSRTETRTQVGEMYRSYAEFLVDRIGSSSFLTEFDSSADDLAEAALPMDLPLSTGHGDFVAHNMFAGPSGRITVFDPLPRWRVPTYQDLATLVVGIRLLPIQATTQGLALAHDDLDRYERAVLRGYFGSGPVPVSAVRAYQLLVLLDKWSAMLSKRNLHGRIRPHLHEARVRVASRHYQREARRVFAAVTQSVSSRQD